MKLAYEHAQEFIEDPKKEFDAENFPDICDDVKLSTIKEKVLQLDTMAKKILAGRQENDALRLDQPKLKFCFDETTKLLEKSSSQTSSKTSQKSKNFKLLEKSVNVRKLISMVLLYMRLFFSSQIISLDQRCQQTCGRIYASSQYGRCQKDRRSFPKDCSSQTPSRS